MTDIEVTIGVDLGTHGARCLATDAKGAILAQSRADYERLLTVDGGQEQPIKPLRAALFRAIRGVTTDLSESVEVVGLAITHQRGTLIALDAAGEALGPAVCDSDMRSWPQARELEAAIGREVLHRRTGCPPLPFNGLTKILWWQENRDATSVAAWASVQDWAVLTLSGKWASSPGASLRMGTLEISHRDRYAESLLSRVGIDVSKLPPLHPLNTQLGVVTPQVSKRTGLRPGTPIFASPGDQPAAVLGTGALPTRDGAINLGTSFVVSLPVQDVEFGDRNTGCTVEVLPEEGHLLEFGTGAGTNVFDWLRNTLLDLPSIETFTTLAEESPPGARGVHVVPHWWSAIDKRAYGSIEGLHANHSRADVVRATFEAVAYEARYAWDIVSRTAQYVPKQLAVFGGASNSGFLCQLLADVIGVPVYRTNNSEASALGAAIVAAVGVGWFDTIAEGVHAMVARKDTIVPKAVTHDLYERSYEAYLRRQNVK